MGLQLFKISPCALRLFIVHVSKDEAAIPCFWEICSHFPDMQSPCRAVLWHPHIPWLFLGA